MPAAKSSKPKEKTPPKAPEAVTIPTTTYRKALAALNDVIRCFGTTDWCDQDDHATVAKVREARTELEQAGTIGL